ncbi:hypothetical protein DFH29DRAFT_287134 [Suillus ampliporus]|nr:hypothetical protein DFH29DRAFT_287134 [Suillus ampliporus]
MISEWKVPEDTGPEEASASKILPARDSCIVGDPAIAEDLFKRETFKLRSASEAQNRELRGQYIGFSEAEVAIRKVISDQLEAAPIRLLNTATGLLCPREVQIRALEASEEYKKLYVLWDVEHPDLRMGYITAAVAMYFRCVMLSHRWEAMEPLLLDIQDKVVYALKAAGGLVKLQSFCKMARDAGYHWAWVDTCCIDQRNTVEVQESLNSMFTWYRNSALTAVYLSDVPPSSKPGAMAKSVWNTRGWTVPEFLAPKVIRFYQQDWSLYLGDDSPNHKESVNIIDELERATGIAARTLIAFQPGMRDAREKLQWVSNRVTTKQEDIAYSLFGIFSIEIPIFYGEKKQKALGRLLQEIVARSGDITALDWVGQSSEFNSCLPADISSYALPAQPLIPSPLSEDKIRTTVSSLQHVVDVDLASKFYSKLERLKAPRFASNRLHLPCIAFHVTEVRRPARETPFTYEVKADGLRDLLITTEETLLQFTPERPTRQTLLLVRSWDRRLLELPEFCRGG